jgi:hypothetical protein
MYISHRLSLSLLQSLNPNIDIVFLLFVLQYILIIGNVEVDPSPELINHSSVSDNSISICNINIRSARNKLDFLNNFTDEFDKRETTRNVHRKLVSSIS